MITYDDDVKTCRLYQVLDNKFGFSDICGRPIGQGNNLCINHKCTTTKHKTFKMREYSS